MTKVLKAFEGSFTKDFSKLQFLTQVDAIKTFDKNKHPPNTEKVFVWIKVVYQQP